MPSVVVLTKFPDIFDGFHSSMMRDAPSLVTVVVKDDGTPFKMAESANRGWRQAAGDFIYAGDDTRIIEPDTCLRLTKVALSDQKIGIVAATIQGTPVFRPREHFLEQPYVPFVFVYIKREVIDKIGYLDERFEGYGVEDFDYCVRARLAGFKVGIAGGVTIQHGVGYSMMSTFRRVKELDQILAEDAENWKRFAEKYGLPNDRAKIWKAIKTLEFSGL